MIAVICGDKTQFAEWCKAHPDKAALAVRISSASDVESLRGATVAEGVMTGTWYALRDLDEIEARVRALMQPPALIQRQGGD